MPFLLVYVTHPSKPEAIRITHDLLEKRIIACANYFPIESMYWWEGSIAHDAEIVTLYKTRSENWEILKTTIEASHKYTTPCIIKVATVEANTSYEAWIQDETKPPLL